MPTTILHKKIRKEAFALHPEALSRLSQIYVIWRLVIKFAYFIYDTARCILNPNLTILMKLPPEVFHAKKNQIGTEDEVYSSLQKSMAQWAVPSISATFFALDTRKRLSSSRFNFPWPRRFIFDALRELYDERSGGFCFSRRLKEADFESSYYAVRILESHFKYLKQADHESHPAEGKNFYFRALGMNVEKTTQYFFYMAENFQANFIDHSRDINLSVLSKALEWSKLAKIPLTELPPSLALRAESHILRDPDNAIHNFLLYAFDRRSTSLDALAAGLRVVSFSTTQEHFNAETILFQCERDIEQILQGKRISPLLNLFKVVVVMDRLASAAILSLRERNKIAQLNSITSDLVEKLQNRLYFKGGYKLNSNQNSAPNLYATRIMIYLLEYYHLYNLMNPEETVRFSDDCFDTSDRLYRCYPFFSKYYS